MSISELIYVFEMGCVFGIHGCSGCFEYTHCRDVFEYGPCANVSISDYFLQWFVCLVCMLFRTNQRKSPSARSNPNPRPRASSTTNCAPEPSRRCATSSGIPSHYNFCSTISVQCCRLCSKWLCGRRSLQSFRAFR